MKISFDLIIESIEFGLQIFVFGSVIFFWIILLQGGLL